MISIWQPCSVRLFRIVYHGKNVILTRGDFYFDDPEESHDPDITEVFRCICGQDYELMIGICPGCNLTPYEATAQLKEIRAHTADQSPSSMAGSSGSMAASAVPS